MARHPRLAPVAAISLTTATLAAVAHLVQRYAAPTSLTGFTS